MEAQVLQLCLKEIDRSHLFGAYRFCHVQCGVVIIVILVGFYGARYGWHDTAESPDELLTKNFNVACKVRHVPV